MNKAIVCGFLVRDPEENGKAVKFIIAVSRDYKNANGDYESDFIRCVAFGNTGKLTKQYCKKGDVVGIKGRIETRTYEDSDGKKNHKTEVIAEKVTFLSSRSKDAPERD